MIDKISLKPDWDYQPKLGNSRGHHITREDEHRILTDFLTRRDEGSLLVCGHRGVGKTSSIIAAINDATINDTTKDKPLIAVLMKATSINFKKDDVKNMQKSLLQGLIRFLYKTVKDDDKIAGDLKNKTEELYDKSLASEAHDERHSGKSKTTEKTFIARFNFGLAALVAVLGSIFSLNFIFDFFDLKLELMQHLWILSSVAVISGILTMYNSRKVITTFFSSTSSYYRHDYDFSDLQSEFEDLTEEYSKKSRILFVLDEFDKFDKTEEFDDAIDAILHMKMLINQGNALFIFITDPEYLDKIREKRSKEYTLFSQILFLKRPLFREMEAFIDDIFSINDEIKNDESYKNFRNYLCYKSCTDFFEIYRVIRDHISGKDPNGSPSIKVSLDDAQLTKANLQKSIDWVYERKKYGNQSKQQINDEMIDALYEFVETVEDYPKLGKVTADKSKISLSEQGVEYKVEEYKERYKMSAVMDLFLLLEKQGYFKHSTGNQYDVIGRLSKFDAKGIFVEEQRVFKEAYDEFKENLVNFANIQSQWIEELGMPFTIDTFESKQETVMQRVGSIFNPSPHYDAKTYYDQLQSSDSPLIATETLQQQTMSIRPTLDLLNKHYMDLLARILEKQLDAPCIILPDTSTDFFTRIGMQDQNVPNAVLELQKKSKGIKNIVIAYSPQVDFLKSVKEKRIPYNNMIICLGGRDRFSDYGKNSFIIDDAGVLEKEIDGFFNSKNTGQSGSGSIPGKDPELKVGKHKTFFFATSLPLDLGVIKKLLDIIRKYRTANQL